MNAKTITKSDLLESENRINKEQQEARHQQNSSIQSALIKADEALNENKILNKSVDLMSKEIKELKDSQKEWFIELKNSQKEWFENISKELKDYIISADNKYATKSEINTISKIIWTIWTIIITAIVWAILKTIWLY